MQTKDQVKNWKVVVSAASVAALGFTGLAVASPDGSNNAPPAINIRDQRDDSAQLNTTTTTHGFEVVSGPVTQFDSVDSIDSVDDTVLASADVDDSADDTVLASADLDDSVDDSPDTAVADDSPDDSPMDSVDESPVDDSVDDSADDSADSSD